MVSTGLANALLQGLVTGCLIAAGALGLSLLYSIAEVPNFAHGDMITVGAYLALAFNRPEEIPFLPWQGGVALVLAAGLAIAASGVLGAVYERFIFRGFRDRSADLITMVIVSLGLAMILQNAVLFLVGSKNVSYRAARVTNTNVDIYAGRGGLTVETMQRQAGEMVLLDRWGYSWLVVALSLALTIGVTVATYQWRRAGADYDRVQLIPPWIAATSVGAIVFAAVTLLARGTGGDPGSALYGTRVSLSVKYIAVLAMAVLVMIALHLVLKRTKLGVAMRATADNMALARVKGVDVDRVQIVVWIVAALLTGLAGVLSGWYAGSLNPNMGFVLLLPIFAAVILGGINSPYGAVLGSLVIGISMDVGVYLLPSDFTTYRIAIAFVVLVGVLLVKPDGIWGDV